MKSAFVMLKKKQPIWLPFFAILAQISFGIPIDYNTVVSTVNSDIHDI